MRLSDRLSRARLAGCAVLIPVALAIAGTRASAASFVGTQTGPGEWTYTLTYDPLDNYSICQPSTTITLGGLSGVTAATGPTSTDYSSPEIGNPFLDGVNLAWTAEVLGGGTAVRWTHLGSGTGNFSIPIRVHGFKVVAAGVANGPATVTSDGFETDTVCVDRDFTATTDGPVCDGSDADGDGIANCDDRSPRVPDRGVLTRDGRAIVDDAATLNHWIYGPFDGALFACSPAYDAAFIVSPDDAAFFVAANFLANKTTYDPSTGPRNLDHLFVADTPGQSAQGAVATGVSGIAVPGLSPGNASALAVRENESSITYREAFTVNGARVDLTRATTLDAIEEYLTFSASPDASTVDILGLLAVPTGRVEAKIDGAWVEVTAAGGELISAEVRIVDSTTNALQARLRVPTVVTAGEDVTYRIASENPFWAEIRKIDETVVARPITVTRRVGNVVERSLTYGVSVDAESGLPGRFRVRTIFSTAGLAFPATVEQGLVGPATSIAFGGADGRTDWDLLGRLVLNEETDVTFAQANVHVRTDVPFQDGRPLDTGRTRREVALYAWRGTGITSQGADVMIEDSSFSLAPGSTAPWRGFESRAGRAPTAPSPNAIRIDNGAQVTGVTQGFRLISGHFSSLGTVIVSLVADATSKEPQFGVLAGAFHPVFLQGRAVDLGPTNVSLHVNEQMTVQGPGLKTATIAIACTGVGDVELRQVDVYNCDVGCALAGVSNAGSPQLRAILDNFSMTNVGNGLSVAGNVALTASRGSFIEVQREPMFFANHARALAVRYAAASGDDLDALGTGMLLEADLTRMLVISRAQDPLRADAGIGSTAVFGQPYSQRGAFIGVHLDPTGAGGGLHISLSDSNDLDYSFNDDASVDPAGLPQLVNIDEQSAAFGASSASITLASIFADVNPGDPLTGPATTIPVQLSPAIRTGTGRASDGVNADIDVMFGGSTTTYEELLALVETGEIVFTTPGTKVAVTRQIRNSKKEFDKGKFKGARKHLLGTFQIAKNHYADAFQEYRFQNAVNALLATIDQQP